MKRPTVAIVKIIDGKYKDAVKQAFDLLGGVTKFIPQSGRVLIKPNWVTAKHYSTGAVTNTKVLAAICDCLLDNTDVSITMADSSCVGEDTESVIKINHVDKLRSDRIDVVDFKRTSYTRVIIPNATKYRRLSIPTVLLNSDLVINVPVMKTHDALPFTLGLKNMKGVLLDSEKKKFHLLGLEEGLIDLNRIVLPEFTMIDASVCMEGDGPANGTPVNLNLLIASDDALAAETIAATVMGFNVDMVKYIKLAYDAGFGEKNIENIHIVGEEISSVIHPFNTSFYNVLKVVDEFLTLHDKTACTGCRNVLVQFLQQRKKPDADVRVNIMCGEHSENSVKDCVANADCAIGMGNCLFRHRKQFDKFISGCPPTIHDLMTIYTETIGANIK